jgi:hypothetical protein
MYLKETFERSSEPNYYLSCSGKILAKRIPRSASKFVPVTYPVPKIIWLTGVWNGIAIGNFTLVRLKRQGTGTQQAQTKKDSEI